MFNHFTSAYLKLVVFEEPARGRLERDGAVGRSPALVVLDDKVLSELRPDARLRIVAEHGSRPAAVATSNVRARNTIIDERWCISLQFNQ
jgi:hypothetical protein